MHSEELRRQCNAALANYDRVISLMPDSPEAYCGRGVVLRKLGDIPAAISSYERAIALRPDFARAHSFRGNALTELGDYAAACESYDRALRIDPQYAEVLASRAFVLRMLGQMDLALDSLDRALAINPRFPVAHNNRGNLLREMGRLEEALVSYDRAIASKPDYAEAIANRGMVLQQLLASYDEAIASRPDYAEAHSNRGIVLQKLQRFDEALASSDRAIASRPDHAEAHSNRGLVLQKLQGLDEALASYDRAIASKPDYAEAHSSRATVLMELLRVDEALVSFNAAIELRPDDAATRFNRALALLLAGRFREGWVEHEWRWQVGSLPCSEDVRPWSQPLWRGEHSLAGKRILLHSEQGLGDTLQFCRYATLVANSGAQVILEVPRSLQGLLAELEGVSSCLARGDPLPPFDVHCPLMSLPYALGTDSSNIPSWPRYLRADRVKIARWAARLGTKSGPRVGIVWSGNRAHTNDSNRSIGLAQLIASLPSNLQYVALQKDIDAGDREVLEAAGSIIDVSRELENFSDTAALCESLDVVISVNTSVAHLPGALGKPVWILLPYNPDWRWQLQRTDSPWYPSARLYRQSERGNWKTVLERVGADLLAMIAAEHIASANSMLDLGRFSEALASCAAAIATRPDMIGGHLTRGLSLFLLGKRAEALQSYRDAIRLDPHYAPAHSDCALVLTELERTQEAVESCDAAITLEPQLLGAHLNRGTALKWMRRTREALESFQTALQLSPDCAEAHWNAALCLLQLGEFETGWQQHEWRKRMQQPLGSRQLPYPEWLGRESLAGKTLLLHAEQGLGDTIQFCRYTQLARAQGASVVMLVPAPLRHLLTSVDSDVRVLTDGDPLPEADFHCPMLSMPLAMKTRLDTIPETGRYLRPDPERVGAWRARIGTDGFKVGIRWQGRTGIRADIGRSPPLARLAPLAGIPGVRLISLQKGAGTEQLNEIAGTLPLEVVLDDDEGPGSLVETAALIDCLDLVISSDTSIAHLAGALARPTWVALKFSPDWRWLLDRSDSPWYRSMRLFRQPRQGDWDSVFIAMRDALLQKCRNGGPGSDS